MDNQKYISYCLYGTDPKYYVGAEKNAIINQELLPDWKTIIYYRPDQLAEDCVDKLTRHGATMIDVSNVVIGGKPSFHFPVFWRYIPFLEDGMLLCRDLDSRISQREVSYIRRWEEGNADYFIIRDHPWHSPVPAGLFGIRRKIPKLIEHFTKFISTSALGWGSDQEMLTEYMNTIPTSEVEYCGYDSPSSYIPRDDDLSFIGMQTDENDLPTKPSGEVGLAYLNEIMKQRDKNIK